MEEIQLSSLEDGEESSDTSADAADEPADAGSRNNELGIPSNCAIVKWPWKCIRQSLFVLSLAAMLGCFGASVTLIARLPQKCEVVVEWWQGKVFYEISAASAVYDSDGDGIGDLNGLVARVDHLQNDLHVDVVKLASNFVSAVSATDIDPRIGNLGQLRSLATLLERKNMSLVVDLDVDRLAAIDDDDDDNNIMISAESRQMIANVLVYWIGQGVHGFHLKGLERLAHRNDLLELVARWRSAVDRLGSGLKQRRILIVSSHLLASSGSADAPNGTALRSQFDLVEHFVDMDRGLDTVADQIRRGVHWDSDVHDSPWILWTLRGSNGTRLADDDDADDSVRTASLMFLASLPGSVSMSYADGCVPGAIGRLNELRRRAAPLYTNAVVKYDANDRPVSRSINYVYRTLADSRTVLVERFYPRRHRYLLISNLSRRNNVTHDLSNTYFGGEVLVSSTGTKVGYVRLKQLHLQPGEGLVLLLDK